MEKKRIVIVLLLAFMPIFCLLSAQGPVRNTLNVNKQAIEQRYYDKEINKSNYHDQKEKISDIPQKISERQKSLQDDLHDEARGYSFWCIICGMLTLVGISVVNIGLHKCRLNNKVINRCSILIAVFGVVVMCVIYSSYISCEKELEKNLAENFISDSIVARLYDEQNKTNEYLSDLDQSARAKIKPLVDSVYRVEVEKMQALRKAEAKRLQQYVEKNNINKKLRIITCSWQKETDIPEHGTLEGDLSSGGGGGGLLGLGVAVGGTRTKGKIKGEYNGRVYGEEYYFFHFILSDNSYHVIDAKKNPMWRMAKDGLIVHYKKTYSNYGCYKEVITPLWTESNF